MSGHYDKLIYDELKLILAELQAIRVILTIGSESGSNGLVHLRTTDFAADRSPDEAAPAAKDGKPGGTGL